MGMFVLFTKSVPGSVTQLVLNPVGNKFVCTCNRQPRWSAGQESVNPLPDKTAVILVGFIATADALAPNTALPSQMRAVMLAALHVRRLAADAARRDEAVERCLDLFAFARDSVVAREPVLAPALLFAPSIANVCAAATQGASPAGRARAEAGLAAIEAGVPDARWLSQASPPRAASVRLVSRLRTLLEFLRAGLVARRFHEANSRWPSAAELGDSVPQDARSGTTTVVEASGRDWVLRGAAPAEVRGTDGAFEGDFVVTRWDENDAVTLTLTPDGRSPRAGAL